MKTQTYKGYTIVKTNWKAQTRRCCFGRWYPAYVDTYEIEELKYETRRPHFTTIQDAKDYINKNLV